MSFAPDSMPDLDQRRAGRWGGVQKQKTSGFTSRQSAAASVDVARAAQLRGGLRRAARHRGVGDAGQLETRVGLERGGVVPPALAQADDDDLVGVLAIDRVLPVRLVPRAALLDRVVDLARRSARGTSAARGTRRRSARSSGTSARDRRACPRDSPPAGGWRSGSGASRPRRASSRNFSSASRFGVSMT